jgi:ribosomal protein S18 acetylase RimI-like enzyme
MNSNRNDAAPVHSLPSRTYETEHDLQRMQDLLMTARAGSGDWRYPHVGDLMWTFFMVACHLDPREHVRLWHDPDGRLAGYAILGEDPSFDCQVLPGPDQSAIEAEALAWAEARLGELRGSDPGRWGGDLLSGARQDDESRREFLERHGFRPRGYVEVNMMRSLAEPIAAPAPPAGWQIRAVAGPGEASIRAAAQRAVWQPWTVGDVSGGDYARLMRLPGYERELDVVAVSPDGEIAAYVNGWADPLNRIGDFGPVGTLPAYRRQGLARSVLLEALGRMKAYGMDRVCVSTGESNAPARRLYESVGFVIQNRYLETVKDEDRGGGADPLPGILP